MAGPLVADQATITNMVDAFETCQGECAHVESIIDTAYSNLGTNWQSDTAAKKFMDAINEWIAGFEKVRQGLDMLNGNMQQYMQLTGTTEEGSAAYAGGWAQLN